MGNLFLLLVVSVFSITAPLSSGIYTYRWLKPEMKILLLLFVIAALVEGYTFYQALNRASLHWVHHLYAPLEYSLLAFVFSFWQKKAILIRALRLSIPIFILVCAVSIFTLENLKNLNNFTASLSNTLYVVVSAYTLLNLQRNDSGSIYKDYRFWISSALLLYSTSSLAYFAFHNYFFSFMIWAIHVTFNIVANLLYSMGFICQRLR